MNSDALFESKLRSLAAPASRQGARQLRDRRRPPADRRERSPVRFRRRAARSDSRQGPRADGDLEFLVRAHAPHRREPPDRRAAVALRDGPRRARAARGPRGRRAPPQAAAGRGGRARLPDRLRLEGLPGRAAGSAASPCRRASQQASRLPAPIFTPATKAAAGQHDENVPFEEIEETIGGATAARVRELALALYGFAADYARGARHPDRRHEVRVRARRGAARSC